MVMSRTGDELERQRQRQFMEVNGRWYFNTREGINVGPFRTKTDAIAGVEELIRRLAQPLRAPRTTIVEFVQQRCSSWMP